MDDRRDELDSWLHERVDPLSPPPGTFELIKRRARRRKFRQVAVSAGALAAVIAAIIVVPHVTSSLNITQHEQGSSAANGAGGSGSSAVHSAMGTAQPEASPSAQPSRAPAAGPPPVPADFAATSVTFIGSGTGWVIGQAGAPGQPCATNYCTSVARTDDAGKTWYGVHAPVTGPPSGASGVGQIRFLNGSDGWAFGPGLFATHDGGRAWKAVPTGGYRVTDLETVGDRAFAVFASCAGTGITFAQCTSFSLYSAAAGSNDWAAVPGASGLSAGGQATSASLVLTGSRGYLLAPGGTLYAGPVDGGAWQPAGSGPAGGASCTTGAAQQNGQPSGAMLAAADSSHLVLACAIGAGSGGGAQVFASSDAGKTWQQAGTAPGGTTVTSLAAQPGGEIALATTAGLDVSHDGGATWQQLEQGAAGPAGGFSYVGLTSPAQGVAVPANPGEHAIWFTYDGGLSWAPSSIKG
jgi:hypothetical protein